MIKNLIIKSSYSKLINGQLKSNFGDLIRTTVLLSCIGNDFYWLTDKRAVRLLKWFVEPKRIITFDDNLDNYDFSYRLQIYNVDNFVHDKRIFNQIRRGWHGYIPGGRDKVVAENSMIECIGSYNSTNCSLSWQQALVEGMGFLWKDQDYAFSSIYNIESVDIGLNYCVHPDWESKQWPKNKWEKLEKILLKTKSVSWQKGLNNFDKYINWLSSCRVIVTVDTLGLHLASALRKKIVAIVGPTNSIEHPYNRVTFIKPDYCECMPCNLPVCKMGEGCLNEIDVERVSEIVLDMFSFQRIGENN